MDFSLTGTGPNDNIRQQVDPSFQAARVSVRPLEYSSQGAVGGHFCLAATFTTTSATVPIAGAPLFTMRWADSRFLYVLERVTVTCGNVTTVFSAATAVAVDIIAARNFTTNPTGGTSIVLANSAQKKRSNAMSGSLLATSGDMQISSGAGISAGGLTLDTLPFGYAFVMASTTTIGAIGAPVSLFEIRDHGTHPMIFGNNEGFLIRNDTAFPATGIAKFGFNISWSEVPAY